MIADRFLYFAYGSNMLTSRLAARCPSAKPLGPASAHNWRVDFSRRGKDGSGKASLRPGPGETAHGVLFEIARPELAALDRAEGPGYDRIDDFPVYDAQGEELFCSTYIGNEPEDGLKPYDWYLALILAGAHEHQLEDACRAMFRAILHEEDRRAACDYRDAALEALRAAGHDSPASVLKLTT